MEEFDPEKFEDKYEHYFTELQMAYRNAFEYMNDRYDSELIHAIDQNVLAESEPFYEGSAEPRSADESSEQSPRDLDGEFRLELPEDPVARLGGVMVADDRAREVLSEYADRIERELRVVFGFEE